MVRKFKTLLPLFCLIFAGTAYGLGLGEITLKSSLNQPLLAEIEVLQEQGMEPGEILPTLASQDDFRRAGILREFFLSNLLFKFVSVGDDQLLLIVTTKEPVQEPFLNFMLEVNWATGRVLKEYTLLLDPPLYDNTSVTSFSSEPIVAAPVTTTVVEAVSETISKAVKTPAPVRDESLAANEYRVKQNDTLWQIAIAVRTDKTLTPHQIMLAVQQMNPDAFLNNNINRLKEGSLLVIPSNEDIKRWGMAESVAEVGRQNKMLSSPTGTTPASVSAVAPTAGALPAVVEQNPEGYLELVSGADEQVGSASSGSMSAQSAKLTADLATALEFNDQLARENSELTSRLDALQEQLTLLQNLINLQSETGAVLAVQSANAAVADTDHADEAMPMAADTDHAVSPQTAEAMPMATVEADHVDAVPHGQDEVAAEPQSFIGFLIADIQKMLFASVLNLALVGLAVLLIIGLLVVTIVKRRGAGKPVADFAAVDNGDEFDVDGLGVTDVFDDPNEDTVSQDHDLERVDSSDARHDAGGSSNADIVAEADIYIAYSRYDQAEELLKSALAEDSSREDVKLKLAEVYVETGNVEGFKRIDTELKSGSSYAQQTLTGLRAQLPTSFDTAPLENLDLDDFNVNDLPDDFDSIPQAEAESDVSEDNQPPRDELDIDVDSELSFEDWDGDKSSFDLDGDLLFEEDGDISSVSNAESDESEFTPPSEMPVQDAVLSTDIDDHQSEFEADDSEIDDGDIVFDMDKDLVDVDKLADKKRTVQEPQPMADLGADSTPIETPSELGDSETDDDFLLDFESVEFSTPAGETAEVADKADDDNSLNFDTDAALDDEGLDFLTDEKTLPAADSDDSAEKDDLDGSIDFETAIESLDEFNADLDSELAAMAEDSASALKDLNLEDDADAPMFTDDSFDLGDLEDLNSDLGGMTAVDDFEMMDGADEISTKLDLARAYIDMEEKEGAREILQEVIVEGSPEQIKKAEELLAQIG